MRTSNIAPLTPNSAAPTITTHISPAPGPVSARDEGALAAVGLEAAAVPDGAEAAPLAGSGDGEDALVGALEAVLVGALGAGTVDAGDVDAVVAGGGVEVGADVGGGAVAASCTTVNPPTLFPETWPGEVSPTKVYRGDPL